MNFLFEHLAIATYVIGFVAVFFFSLDEFNAPEYPYVEENDHEDQNEIDFSPWAKLASPALPRYMADPISYSVSMYCFALIAAAIYVWFALILSSLHVKPDALPALISASIMVGLAKFDDFDFIKEKAILKLPKKLVYGLAKSLLHSYLFIPKLGQEIFDILCFARIDYGSEQARANLDTLLAPEANTGVNPGRHLDLADFKTPGNSRTMTARWARLSYFKLIIEQWAQDDRFKSHVNDRSLKWRLLKNAYNNLTEQMIRFRDKDADMAPEKETELSKKIDHLLANCYRLLSCVTVMASKSQEHPTQLLQETGLRVNKIQGLRRQGQIFRLVFVMFPLIALMVGIFAFGAQSDVGDVIQRIFTCIESSIYLFVLPILFIISVNQHMAVSGTWAAVCSDTPPKNFFDRPLGLYLILSGISYAAALFFMMLRISPHAHGLVAPKSAWLSMGIFCSITAVTVFFICIRCDSPAKIFKTRLKFSIFVLQYSLPHAVFTAVIVWTGLKVSPSPNRVYQDFWQYPLMGFVVSIAIGTTLFYGKHKIEKRSETDRTECDEAVRVILDGLELQARLINKSANGSMLRLAHTHIMLQKNARIEIIFRDGIKKIGAIVEAKTNNLNVAYQG